MATRLNCPADLREYIAQLEAVDELRRISTEVDWRFEVGAMSRLVCERRAPAPLFHTRVSDFAAAWSEPSKRKILDRWKEYGYGVIR